MGSIPRTSQEGLSDFCYCTNTNNFRSSVSDFCGSDLFSCQAHLYILRLLTHVRFFRQSVLILSVYGKEQECRKNVS